MLAALLASAYLSQTPVPPKAAVENQKKTVLIFTDEDPVTAGPHGPEGVKITVRPAFKAESILKLRSDFNDKVIDSAHEL